MGSASRGELCGLVSEAGFTKYTIQSALLQSEDPYCVDIGMTRFHQHFRRFIAPCQIGTRRADIYVTNEKMIQIAIWVDCRLERRESRQR